MKNRQEPIKMREYLDLLCNALQTIVYLDYTKRTFQIISNLILCKAFSFFWEKRSRCTLNLQEQL